MFTTRNTCPVSAMVGRERERDREVTCKRRERRDGDGIVRIIRHRIRKLKVLSFSVCLSDNVLMN